MIVTASSMSATEFAALTGWERKPEGWCRGEICVPMPSGTSSTAGAADATTGTAGVSGTADMIDVAAVAERLGMPYEVDHTHGVGALGPATVSGRALTDVRAHWPAGLIDRAGDRFDASSLVGRRIIMVAWASW